MLGDAYWGSRGTVVSRWYRALPLWRAITLWRFGVLARSLPQTFVAACAPCAGARPRRVSPAAAQRLVGCLSVRSPRSDARIEDVMRWSC